MSFLEFLPKVLNAEMKIQPGKQKSFSTGTSEIDYFSVENAVTQRMEW